MLREHWVVHLNAFTGKTPFQLKTVSLKRFNSFVKIAFLANDI